MVYYLIPVIPRTLPNAFLTAVANGRLQRAASASTAENPTTERQTIAIPNIFFISRYSIQKTRTNHEKMKYIAYSG